MSTFMTTCPIPFNTTQKSGIPEDALTKRSQVIKNKKNNSNVKNFMAVPPTPPDEPIIVPSQKRTVTFQLPPEVLAYDTPEELYLPLSPSPPPELECIELSKDVLVPLMERDKDVRELVTKNKTFFDTVKSSFGSEEKWQEFNKILHAPRVEMCDNLWMNSLTEYLCHNPALLQKFKYIVGYFESGYNDDDSNIETGYSLSWSQNEYTDITLIRAYAEKLHRFEESYPQFFVKAHECLSQEKRSILKRKKECNMEYDLFGEFKEIFFADRSVLEDDDWEMQVYDCLDNWPDLAMELERIIEYEAQDSDVEDDNTESSDDDEEYFYTS
ncbi:1378_t:CDS:1 [Paraglomus brasilianum]|uniref:1378_t:CDS:1 n=1 Tax=Paraglomus brasilianum TaxID=144538 RepID=A0A9N9EXH7_9GLOM|nr:1378_t:CDS:1 [Paraglomus brasilianum]